MSDPIIDDFVLRAQAVTVTEAAASLDIRVPKGDKGQPCPQCGGKDRFSINATKQVWNCRGCGNGGRTGIGLAGHVLRYDLHSRSGFLEACAAVLGESIPEGGERESAEERAARETRMAESRARIASEEAERERQQNDFRDREMQRARGIYFNAQECLDETLYGARMVRAYLRRRTGYMVPMETFINLRFDGNHTYWHGQDEFGRPASIHSGPAMIAPFVTLDGQVTGCHETWIDMQNAPKFRPDLGRDDKGETLTTKKMRGTKKGSLIPILGDMEAQRWLGGEGIETVAAVAGYEGFRSDTFYFAAGDLGNLAGPADRSKGRSESHVGANGKKVRVYPYPKSDQDAAEAIQLPPHVNAFVLLADGDSEFYFTAAAMARAKARLARDGRSIRIWWPPQGMDFASLLSERA
ncbi:phage primase/helicase protein [Rhizobium etli 8C-3]|uniref:Phage primase/helicase protein n=1 Tax=Rhizobium etli 8C-3 TaxID=538025 RepID=A0A1L5P258_RHIET|nr:hypothetical protein [Rhizobium etli]APO74252.1 phage primase/helicase protein [Rhizobium etli 8C-3]